MLKSIAKSLHTHSWELVNTNCATSGCVVVALVGSIGVDVLGGQDVCTKETKMVMSHGGCDLS